MSSENNTHKKLITESWQRCRDFGLQHDAAPELQKLQRSDTGILLDSQRHLIQTTAHAVLPYYDNILNNSPCLILLADSRGQVLNSWGERRFLTKAQRQWFAAGASWQEVNTGTNAIGTALAAGEAVQIQRDEHYFKRHRYMIGSAAPIFDASNQLLGVLDISSDTYMPQAHTLGMVRLMSQSIENRLIIDKYQQNHYLLTVNTHVDNLVSQWSGLIVFDREGSIIAFNRRAELLLNFSLSGTDVEQILACNLSFLCQQVNKSAFELRVLDKYSMFASLQEPTDTQQSEKKLSFMLPAADKKPPIEIPFSGLEFGDPKLKKAIAQGSKVIEKDIPILIFGETGVGKEVFVKALHQYSSRGAKALVALNCAAIPADLVESELFGYVKGAFTGADSKGAIGLIRKADKGILFLDEIGDMPLNVQGRLLRVLQERKVTPLGSTQSYPVDVKLISATNCNLKALVGAGLFRKDLFYRVSGLNIEIPTLSTRMDKRSLFSHLIKKKSQSLAQAEISPEIMTLFLNHPWPGNIRQFISVLDVALAMADEDPIGHWHLPDDFFDDLAEQQRLSTAALATDYDEFNQLKPNQLATANAASNSSLSGREAYLVAALASADQKSVIDLSDVDSDHLSVTYQRYQECHGNLSKTAKELGISRNTLYKRLRQLGLK